MIGAGRHTGVTHLAVWTANYLTGVKGQETAVLEWNDHGDFERMRRFGTGEAAKSGSPDRPDRFHLLDVDYYPCAGAEQMASCLNADYRYIIIDFGEITGESILECARCDRKVIVGALSEWQAEAFLGEVKECGKRDRSWIYAAAFGSGETRRQIEKTFPVSLLRIPASEDAFAVTRADMDFFKWL